MQLALLTWWGAVFFLFTPKPASKTSKRHKKSRTSFNDGAFGLFAFYAAPGTTPFFRMASPRNFRLLRLCGSGIPAIFRGAWASRIRRHLQTVRLKKKHTSETARLRRHFYRIKLSVRFRSFMGRKFPARRDFPRFLHGATPKNHLRFGPQRFDKGIYIL